MIRWAGRAIAAWFTSRADLIAENLCLRQQLVVLQRRTPRPRLRNADRRFWILACRWVPRWREFLLVVQPATVLGWHRHGWTAYWRWRSRRGARGGRPHIAEELRGLIRRMAAENRLWGQRRVQAELARLGFTVSARTVAAYMRRPYDGVPSPRWREFLTRHAQDIWACDFFSVRTIFFQTLDVFFVMHHGTREIVEARVTRQPTAEWADQQIVAACGWERDPPRYLIRDRDGRFLNECHLQGVLDEYVAYFNAWRPHRGLGQRAPCGSAPPPIPNAAGKIIGRPVLGGLHHVYEHAV